LNEVLEGKTMEYRDEKWRQKAKINFMLGSDEF